MKNTALFITLPNFYHDTVKINNGIQRIQRTILPFSHQFFYRIGDFRYQRGGHVGVIHFFEGRDDFTRGHAIGVQGQNLAIHLRYTCLVFLYQLRHKGIFTVTRRVEFNLSIVAQQRF